MVGIGSYVSYPLFFNKGDGRPIKILAIDQSTKCSGWSLWENKRLLEYGMLEANKKEKNAIERMHEMYFLIKELIRTQNPNYVVVEHVQYQNNQKTYNQLSQLQGVIFSILFERNLGFTLIEPTAWKKFCNIQGRKRVEQKASTIQMVKDEYNLEVPEDIADSIGIGRWAVSNIKVGQKEI